jgi:phosphatidylserine/phosphatidylglycerophosphate/cardiolipin synthase-like enzyme
MDTPDQATDRIERYLAQARAGKPPSWWVPTHKTAKANSISSFIDGAEYFPFLKSELEKAKHYILVTGFFVDPYFRLTRIPERETAFWNIVQKMTGQKPPVAVRIIINSFGTKKGRAVYLTSLGWKSAKTAQKVLEDCGHDHCRVVLSNAIGNITGALHQKSVVIDGMSAFCGGLDITTEGGDRWDTDTHHTGPRLRNPDEPLWHDGMIQITGPIVGGIQENFRRRWMAAKGSALDVRFSAPAAASSSSVLAQVVRTIPSPATIRFQSQVDVSEYSVFDVYARAILNAQKYIYIEQQYFTCGPLVKLLENVLKERRNLHLILLLPGKMEVAMGTWLAYLLDTPSDKGTVSANAAVNLLRSAGRNYGYDRVFAACPKSVDGRLVYVHSKLMLVDDVFGIVGSANFSNRAMLTGEEEIGVAWYDPSSVRKLRTRLWSEHLGLSAEKLLKDSEGVEDKLFGAKLFALWARSRSTRMTWWPLE